MDVIKSKYEDLKSEYRKLEDTMLLNDKEQEHLIDSFSKLLQKRRTPSLKLVGSYDFACENQQVTKDLDTKHEPDMDSNKSHISSMHEDENYEFELSGLFDDDDLNLNKT